MNCIALTCTRRCCELRKFRTVPLPCVPYPTQLLGAATLLRGQLAEMQTGEGKTLTAGLAACLAGAAGVPVHVVTVNDYLAQRDAEKMAPLFAFMGLKVGSVIHGIAPEVKRRAYGCEIAYCTNKELVFDYLRDRVASGGRASAAQIKSRTLFGTLSAAPMLRGLHLAIVDEADSILIDEARTPLILAEKAGPIPNAESFGRALAIAAHLKRDEHYTIERSRRELNLTAQGRAHLTEICAADSGPWRAAHEREHLVTQALRATYLFLRDEQYLIDGERKVQIIDEYTGRVLPGRNWEQGLHQMIEAKEGLELSEQTQTLARITYQRFFTRYLRLGGMTGTAREMAQELMSVYRLRTVTIPTHRPSARRRLPDRVCANETQKWQAVAEFVAECYRQRAASVGGYALGGCFGAIERCTERTRLTASSAQRASGCAGGCHRGRRGYARGDYRCDQHGGAWHGYSARRWCRGARRIVCGSHGISRIATH